MDKIKAVLGSDMFEMFQKNNVTTSKLLLSDLKELENLTDLPRDALKQAKIAISEQILRGKIETASNYASNKLNIPSGCSGVDSICAGGFPANGICEIVGPSGVGKTQMCLQFALQVQLPENLGGLAKEVVYISTEGPFPTRRLKQLSSIYQKKYELKPPNFEDHVYLRHLNEYLDLQKCLEQELPLLLRNKNIGLIIIDSIAGVFRVEDEEIDYISRSANILKITTILNRIQDEFGCAIFTTNQVADNLELGTWEPCLGLAWSNQVTYRFQMSRSTEHSSREFKIDFAPDLPRMSCRFLITEGGIVDFE